MRPEVEQISRAFKLSCYPNTGKQESIRYTYEKHLYYVQVFLTQLFYHPSVKFFSTKGFGQLANQSQHRANAILKAARASARETGNKLSCPQVKKIGCPAIIEKSENSFDYWVSVEDQFSKRRIRFPVRSHKRLNGFLKNGYALCDSAELVCDKNGKFYVRVFAQKEVKKAKIQKESLGVDVGLTHCVSRSDGYLGVSAKRILKKARDRDAERRTQSHQRSIKHSSFKQQLDIEAKRAIARCKRRKLNLIVESPKVLANLKPSLQWARSYFANRCHTLGQESEIYVWDQNPAYTSQTCYRCGYRHKQNRVKSKFKCLGCGSSTHADINASRVIALKGSTNLSAYADRYSGVA